MPLFKNSISDDNIVFVMLKKYGIKGTLNIIKNDILFDYLKGVDTFLPVAKEKLYSGDRLEETNWYLGTPFELSKDIISLIKDKIEFKNTNFVDIGCGKGKVLIAANKFKFAKTIGIEYSEELGSIAKKNIKKLQLDDHVEVKVMDATQYTPNPNDQVFYFFNPFTGKILDDCLKNLNEKKVNNKDRYFLYSNPVEDSTFCKYFDKVGEYILNPGRNRVNVYKG